MNDRLVTGLENFRSRALTGQFWALQARAEARRIGMHREGAERVLDYARWCVREAERLLALARDESVAADDLDAQVEVFDLERHIRHDEVHRLVAEFKARQR